MKAVNSRSRMIDNENTSDEKPETEEKLTVFEIIQRDNDRSRWLLNSLSLSDAISEFGNRHASQTTIRQDFDTGMLFEMDGVSYYCVKGDPTAFDE